ncbi:MAG: hypothetical protein ACRD2Z_05965 [Thermoanaerobaculia bacterium]
MRRTLIALLLSAVLPASAHADCVEPQRASSLDEIVVRVHEEQLKYVFVGERHGVGPVKKFAVDLANALVWSGLDVGLYVEGFRTNCPPGDDTCWSLARAFNMLAFRKLVDESWAPVHAIDPPEGWRRAAKMAATIAEGPEAVKVVLIGRSHVVHAGDPDAEVWVYGGALKFPDPGDVVKKFLRQEVLTLGLETSRGSVPPYSLLRSGCGVDYVVMTENTGQYLGTLADADPAR